MPNTSAVKICSNALVRLGSSPISSFDEADTSGSNLDAARVAANLWPTTRQMILRSHFWNCALKSVKLSPDVTPPVFGFGQRFQLPSDWIRTKDVFVDRYTPVQYRTEGNFIEASQDFLFLRYVFDNENPSTYDTLLVGVLEFAMQAAMAYAITKSTSLAEALNAKLENEVLPRARAIDGQDDPPEALGDYPMRAAGFSNSYGVPR